jgi:hypothetical protein
LLLRNHRSSNSLLCLYLHKQPPREAHCRRLGARLQFNRVWILSHRLVCQGESHLVFHFRRTDSKVAGIRTQAREGSKGPYRSNKPSERCSRIFGFLTPHFPVTMFFSTTRAGFPSTAVFDGAFVRATEPADAMVADLHACRYSPPCTRRRAASARLMIGGVISEIASRILIAQSTLSAESGLT